MSLGRQAAPPVFVGGCPRSGTTLVRTMLNSHPELAVPHETNFLVNAYWMRDRWGDLTDPENRRRVALWVTERRKSNIARLRATPEELVEAMTAAGPTIGSVLGAAFETYAREQGKPRWGDKRPNYVNNLDALFAMFPDARFVHVVRDPRAAISSIMKFEWHTDPLVAGIEIWGRAVRMAERWDRRRPGQILQIAYEELVADPEPVLTRVLDHLGLDVAGLDEMQRFHEEPEIRSKRFHPLLTQPLTGEAVRAWEQRLASEHVAFIEAALGSPMRRYGYEPANPAVAVSADLRRRLARWRRMVRLRRARRWVRRQRVRALYRRPVAWTVRGS